MLQKKKNFEIDVIGKYEFNKIKYFQKKINLNILFLDEDFLNPKDFIEVFRLIDNPEKYNFFFKVKITSKLPKFFRDYLKSNNIKIVDHLNFIKTIKTYNISKVVAYSSTGLLEASYFGLIPIKLNFKIKKDHEIFETFINDKIVLNANTKKTFNKYLNIKKYDNKKIKKTLWKNCNFKYKSLKKILQNHF